MSFGSASRVIFPYILSLAAGLVLLQLTSAASVWALPRKELFLLFIALVNFGAVIVIHPWLERGPSRTDIASLLRSLLVQLGLFAPLILASLALADRGMSFFAAGYICISLAGY